VELTLVAVVAVALFFDFTNGFHDTANSIATSVSTRALSPRAAVLSAAVLNVAGAFVSFEVAATVAKGIVVPEVVTLDVVLAGLVGAITWNLITWYLGLPSSSSHALIGGVAGSALAAAGADAVQWAGLYEKVLIPSLLAPFLGIVLAAALMIGITWIIQRRAPGTVNRVFRRLQLISGGFVAFTHGTNDAQKTMGIIALALVASGHLAEDFERPPFWVILSAALAMGAGTYAGGWRASSRLSGSGWPSSTRHRDSPRRRRAPRSCGAQPTSAFRSRRLTPSPARSSAPARRGGSRRFDGASRATSSWRGS
jgi:inorganic phosphate transporter, PiT family